MSDQPEDDEVRNCIRETFVKFVVPDNIMWLFHKYDIGVLTENDIQRVKGKTSVEGPMEGAQLLLNRLPLYQNWFPCLMKVLQDEHVKLGHVAKTMQDKTDMSRQLPQSKSAARPLPQVQSQRTTGVRTRSKAGGATMTSLAQTLYPDLCQVSKPGSSEPLDLILIGKSGHGKSALGNSILGRKVFQINNKSSTITSITPQNLIKESVDYQWRTINVVDGLNVGECTSTDQGDVERDITYLTKALKLCNNGFSALLIVINFGVEFSEEEEEALKLVKAILGGKVLGLYGICVITFGDNYEHSLEEEEFKNFKEWCSQQPAALGHLIKECDNRYVIFNNRTKDEKEKTKQLDNLFQTIAGLSKNGKRRYSEKDFEIAKKQHDTLLRARKPQDVERKTPMLMEDARERLKEIEKAGGPEDKLMEMKKLVQKLDDHRNLLEKTSGRSSMKAQACVAEITALILDIESRIKNFGSVESQMSGNYYQGHANFEDENHRRGQGASHQNAMHWPKDVDLLLIGKTGNGKRALGNAILRRKIFQSKSSVSSVTKEVQCEVSDFNGRVIKVVVAPGVGDTRLTNKKSVDLVMKAMKYAIDCSPLGYHAFLLVVRYGVRFTDEDRDTIAFLKRIFGEDSVRNYCILVFTYGDLFENDSEETGLTFQDWCQEQRGIIRELLRECNNRAILFENTTKDESKRNQQVSDLITMVDNIKS